MYSSPTYPRTPQGSASTESVQRSRSPHTLALHQEDACKYLFNSARVPNSTEEELEPTFNPTPITNQYHGRLRIFVPTSLCAHVSICPKKYFVPTSLYAPKKWYFVPTSLCAHVSLCPKKWYFVPTSLCAHVSICPNVCQWEFRVGIFYVNSQTYQWPSNGQTEQWSVVKLTNGQAVVKLTRGKAVGKLTSCQAVFKMPMWSSNVKNDQWSSSSQTDQCVVA